MVFLDIDVSFTSENIEKIYVQKDFVWYFNIKCTQCNTDHPNQIYFTSEDQVDTTTTKSQCQFFMNCKNCKKNMQINYYDKSHLQIECKNDKSKGTLATFECRGVEITQWQPQQGIKAQSKGSNFEFNDVDLTDTWCEYDEDQGVSVEIDNFKSEIVRNKKLK